MNRELKRFRVQRMDRQGQSSVTFDFISSPRITNLVRRGRAKVASCINNLDPSPKYNNVSVFAEGFDSTKKKILDPRSAWVRHWNKFFAWSCLMALYVDPLFFLVPIVDGNSVCVKFETKLAVSLTVLRTCTDTLYLIHIGLQFRTAFISTSSQRFGRGELVTDLRKIAARYLMKNFWLDVIAMLPLPQIVIWVFIPLAGYRNYALQFVVFVQYLPRLLSSRIFPLTSRMVKANDVAMEIAWAGAAYNLILYILASHMVGACWYLVAVERQDTCWREFCFAADDCHPTYFDCGNLDNNPARVAWLNNQTLNALNAACTPTPSNPSLFNYGLFINALTNKLTSTSSFVQKYFYCLWFGILNLSSLGQTLQVSSYIWEIIFAIAIVIAGLLLFAVLIGNMQTYLQSSKARRNNKRRKKRTEAEQWMRHRNLPMELKSRIRKYDQFKWVATTGIDEESILQSLPLDLRRDIKRHLCFDLVRGVPLFRTMDDIVVGYICERLKPAFSTENTYIIREGDPVNEMLFIIRGHLVSTTGERGQTSFYNFDSLGPGDFCGEELLAWALDPNPSKTFPSSTRTVKTVNEVEAFVLEAEDLKFVACKFPSHDNNRLQRPFRYLSVQWRTWAATFIQVTWRRYQRRELAKLPKRREEKWRTWAATFIQVTWRRYQRRKLAKLPKRQEENIMQGTISSNDRAVHTSLSLEGTSHRSRLATKSMRSFHLRRSERAASRSSLFRSFNLKVFEPNFSGKDD